MEVIAYVVMPYAIMCAFQAVKKQNMLIPVQARSQFACHVTRNVHNVLARVKINALNVEIL